MTVGSALSLSASILHLALAVGCVIHVLRSRKRASATILWILTVIYLPWIGALAYMVFGVTRVRRRIEARQSKARMLLPYLRELPGLQDAVHNEADHPSFSGACPEVFREFFRLLDNLTGLPALPGNRCELMYGGEEVYGAMAADIDRAQHSVHLQTYILDDDEVGRTVLEAIARRAEAGVEVRVLVDGLGSNTFPPHRVKQYRRRGVDMRVLRQIQPLRGRFAINLRNHRKLLICDGRVAYTGGMNISQHHLLRPPEGHPVLDYHTRIEGPVVNQLQRGFAEDWFDVSSESILRREYFPEPEHVGDDTVRAIPGGPDQHHRVLLKAFCAAVQTAGRSIDVVSPYFVPDPALLMLLELAALGGVRTRVVVPRANNYSVIKYASRYRYAELMRAGVEIYEREPPFSHAKLFLVDDVWACIGSANWDMRSFHLQFDTNVGIVSPEYAHELKEAIDREVAASRRIDPATFLPRPPIKRVLERTAALFEDLL